MARIILLNLVRNFNLFGQKLSLVKLLGRLFKLKMIKLRISPSRHLRDHPAATLDHSTATRDHSTATRDHSTETTNQLLLNKNYYIDRIRAQTRTHSTFNSNVWTNSQGIIGEYAAKKVNLVTLNYLLTLKNGI